jgi:hypothetical protein
MMNVGMLKRLIRDLPDERKVVVMVDRLPYAGRVLRRIGDSEPEFPVYGDLGLDKHEKVLCLCSLLPDETEKMLNSAKIEESRLLPPVRGVIQR